MNSATLCSLPLSYAFSIQKMLPVAFEVDFVSRSLKITERGAGDAVVKSRLWRHRLAQILQTPCSCDQVTSPVCTSVSFSLPTSWSCEGSVPLQLGVQGSPGMSKRRSVRMGGFYCAPDAHRTSCALSL